MRLLSRLEYERSFGARWVTYFVRIPYLLKLLRTHGLIKKVGHRYKYYLTQFGRRVLVATLKLREYVVIPSLCAQTT
jgi:hypothetical protein